MGPVRQNMGIQRVPEVPFAQIANSALRDKRLSFKARGILALVLSNVGEWEATARWIEQQSESDGSTSVQTALNELTELGYRIVRQERDPAGRVRTVTEWYHEPEENRSPENPPTGESDQRETDPPIEHYPLEHYRREDHRENYATAFAAFWEHYPRKVGRRAAEKAWVSAIKTAAPDVIIAGAIAYANDPNREDTFTAHPSTWLNAGRWEDDPIPERTSGKKSGTRMYLEAARELKEQASEPAWVAMLEAR